MAALYMVRYCIVDTAVPTVPGPVLVPYQRYRNPPYRFLSQFANAGNTGHRCLDSVEISSPPEISLSEWSSASVLLSVYTCYLHVHLVIVVHLSLKP